MDPFAIARAQLASGHDPAAVLRQLLASHGVAPHGLQVGPPGAMGHPAAPFMAHLPNGAPAGPPMGPPPGAPMGGPPPGMMGR